MEDYIVEITDDALSDMEALYNYIAVNLRSPENAFAQYDRIASAILTLSSMPERYGLLDMDIGQSLPIHKMIVDNYVIFYVVDPGIVTVTDVLYGASNIEKRLQKRHFSQ